MEALKSLFGEGALTFEQFSEQLSKANGIKLVNLKDGGYIDKDKFNSLEVERNELKTQLEEANAKLEGYDPQWKTKAEEMRQEMEKKVQAVQYEYALKTAIEQAGARNPAVLAGALNQEALKYVDGKIVGLDEQLRALKESDPYLFTPEKHVSSGMSHQGGTEGAVDKKEEANAALRAVLAGGQ